ncbi:MAG: L-glutamate gamma-semialdehyde dehydrogenase [Bdellovibrionales bacterium]|nr:L-glutamate gamma-semialdehyde dehydrogenase [Bdellovibrionales bacterium]
MKNESPLDFTIAQNRAEFQQAINETNTRIEQNFYSAAPIIGGKTAKTSHVEVSVDPSNPDEQIGEVSFANREQCEQAVSLLSENAESWGETPAHERAEILRKIAQGMRDRRNELSALIIREAGKPWKEADADVIEAIDFCDYYAEEMERLAPKRQLMDVMGEGNYYFYEPRGVGLVIAPWNFPLAIPCGMTVASLVTGNTTILKPAEQTSIIAAVFAEIVLQAGVPASAFAFLPGDGEDIGAYLVNHKDIDVICFTGSKSVGLGIIRSAAEVKPGQKNVKKVIAEMGGKNAIIIDEDADLDEAVKGVLYSAFGHAGQKCSACSRVIVVGDAYEPFVSRICEATKDITIGSPQNSDTLINPLIDHTSQKRVLSLIDEYSKVHNLAFRGTTPHKGYFVPPCIFTDVDTSSALWNEEIFAPVLACCKVASFEDAIEVALNSQYALTGGVFSRSPKNIELAWKKYRVGNLYINRTITGAIVCRQPFGGSRMSGVGSKAGGPDYLIQFLEPRTVTENTMRRGFTPELI